jgi:hypothetical protein
VGHLLLGNSSFSHYPTGRSPRRFPVLPSGPPHPNRCARTRQAARHAQGSIGRVPVNAFPISSQTARTAKLPITPQLAGDKLCTPRWFPRGGARCPTIGSAAVSTGLIGKCSWYFSHPTTRIEYNSRSSGGQMLQPVLFYKLPNAVAPGAGRRTHREVQRLLSHAFACTSDSVTFAREFSIPHTSRTKPSHAVRSGCARTCGV